MIHPEWRKYQEPARDLIGKSKGYEVSKGRDLEVWNAISRLHHTCGSRNMEEGGTPSRLGNKRKEGN